MKTRLMALALVSAAMILALTNTVRSGEGEKKGPDASAMSPEDMQKAMESCTAAQKPGAQHELLKRFVGDWNLKTKVWMMPGTPPMESAGTSSIKSVLDGRFIVEDFKSMMMGMPYNGVGMQGFNNLSGQFEGTWTSTMDTHIFTMKGTLQPGKDGKMNVINCYGEMDEPMMGLVGRMINYRTTIIDKDHHTFEIFDLAAGPDYKVIEIEYTRK